ncbi:uncharacterized protein LOC133897003 [Phragmites australis]|uniref:uncharacterized protein LOC133897003 n=1 Tax=Phragmites australis TaxID=29695 RepID=UPI002D78562E|nr:uncharacterized protein LOC133897003 [Phragmites australis]
MAVGHAAAAIGGGDGAGGQATSEEPLPAEGVPAAITMEGDEAEEEEEEKWLNHYSSMQSILIVGDGDFSFSLALATAFGSGANLVATSLDTYEVLMGKYSKAESNIMELKILEATVLHGVDVKGMKFHTDLRNRRFDRIVFNFPHAGFRGPEDQVHMINLHKELVRGFFRNACNLLMSYGEIHVSHKTGHPYDRWDLEHLASESSLIMFDKVDFQKADYPGYNQKRGDGRKCDQPFNLGTCCTFKFQIGELKKRKKLNWSRAGSISSIGGNVHLDKLATDTRPFHLPWLHFSPPFNTARMAVTLQPHVVAQRQQPGFLLNFNGTVRALSLHQQSTVLPMLSVPGPSLNDLPAPVVIPPPMGRIACPNLLAPQEQPWYKQRTITDLPGRDIYSYFEYQRCVQREQEMQRQAMMPGANGLNYSSAFLEDRRRESVQKQEWLRRKIALRSRQ